MDCSATSAALRRGSVFQDILPTSGHHHHQNQQQYEEMWSLERSTSHVVGEDFSIDDLLNFSSIPEEALEQPTLKEEFGHEKMDEDENGSNSNSCSGLSFDVVHAAEPLVPAGDISDLEWVSQIVNDSFVVDLPCSAVAPAYFHHPTTTNTTTHSRSPSSGSITSGSTSIKRTFTLSENTVEVPSKARSKRARTGGRVWSFYHLQVPEPMCSSSVSSSSSCSSTSSPSSCLIFEPKHIDPVVVAAPVVHRGRGRPPLHKKKNQTTTSTHQQDPTAKQHKKKGRKPKAMRPMTAEHHETTATDGVTGRRCSHCGVQKTPQWRAGPLGAKTLCNACGVRYKSGRLLPEYRPAISPTFLDHVHSNSHRKVLEMRRKKELQQQHQPLVVGESAATGPPSPPLCLSTPLPAQHMVF